VTPIVLGVFEWSLDAGLAMGFHLIWRLAVSFGVGCLFFTSSCLDTRWQLYTQEKQLSSLEVQIPNQPLVGLVCAISPDFSQLAYADFAHPVGSPLACPITIADFTTLNVDRVLDGNLKSTQCIAFSGDGQRVISGGANGELIVWNTSDGAKTARKTGHKAYVRCVACSPDGKLVASGGDGEIAIWTLPELTPVRRLKDHSAPLPHGCLVWSADGKYLLSGSFNGIVRLWHVETGVNTATIQPGYGRVMSIAISPNADRALVSYLEIPKQPVVYWDLRNGRELNRFGIPGNPWFAQKSLHINACDISSDGKTALLGTAFGTVLWWDLEKWSEISRSQMHFDELRFVLFDPTDRVAISIGRDSLKDPARIRHWPLKRAQ
jgi:WD40 repeat protein